MDNKKDKEIVHSDELDLKSKENSTWKNLHSKSWCPIPFNTISWHPSGVVSRCMMSAYDMGASHESDQMVTLRQQMLDGEWDTQGCSHCLQKEKIGTKSQRMHWLGNNMMDTLGHPEPYTNPKLRGNNISHLFINFSNVCNFKCRMCSSNYSNSLIPEDKHMDKLFPNEWRKGPEKRQKNFNNINEYLEANPEVLDGIRQVWMTGGEPFMDDSPYKLMELIEEYGHPEKVKMVITTNGSKLDFNKLDKFNKLKKLVLDISIDAVGPMFEYMRSNGVFTWSQMEETCKTLYFYQAINKDWFQVQINSSYQIFNYDNMLDFVEFIADHNMDSNIRLVMFPRHLRIGNLPDSFKKEAHNICDKLHAKYYNVKFKDGINIMPYYRNLIEALPDMRRAIDVSETNLQSFKNITKEQDKFRGMYLYDYNEKLGELVYGSN